MQQSHNELIKLKDETGEEVVYPIRYFLVLTLPAEVENIIEKIITERRR